MKVCYSLKLLPAGNRLEKLLSCECYLVREKGMIQVAELFAQRPEAQASRMEVRAQRNKLRTTEDYCQALKPN